MAGAGEKENAEAAMGTKMKKRGHGRTNANQNTKQYTIVNEKKQVQTTTTRKTKHHRGKKIH